MSSSLAAWLVSLQAHAGALLRLKEVVYGLERCVCGVGEVEVLQCPA